MTLEYHTGGLICRIDVGRGLLEQAGGLFGLDRKVLVVTDDGVPAAYSQKVLAQCREGYLLVVPQGEENKSLDTVGTILAGLLEHGFTRSDAVVAVGGGVVGDMAGFAASIYQRGIEYYNVPTTLLSQVDSSVGGKTAVNFGGVKNIVGAFHHPSAVLIDPDTLDSLSPRLLSEGLAEVIKMAATGDRALFESIEGASDLRPHMEQIIASALRYKIGVVEQDPKEQGLRAVLNFGHTVGHAIEAASAAAGGREFYHGEAVAVGMLYMSEGEARRRIEALLRRFALPCSDPFGTDVLMSYAVHDKKRRGGSIKLVRVSEIGTYDFVQADADTLRAYIQSFKEQ